MMSNIQSGSARIYPFPARGRYAQAEAAQHEPTRNAEQASALRVCIAASSGWYHEAAIEAERASTN